MTTMADAVNPYNIPEGFAAIAGYIDGPKSTWPAAAWAKFGQPTLKISVLANPEAMAFDCEPGNASAAAIALSVGARITEGLPSVVYVDQTTSTALREAFTLHSVPWMAANHWPAPAAYLWAATWDVAAGTIPSWCWVPPVAVQDRHLNTYDLSTLYTGWLPTVPTTPPAPPPIKESEEDAVTLIQLSDGSIAAKGANGHLLIFNRDPNLAHGWSVTDVTDAISADTGGQTYTIG